MLSASAAQARPWAAYHCGKDKIAMLPPKYFWRTNPDCKGLCDSKPHYFRFDAMSDDKDRGPRVDRWIRDTERGLFYKGRKCREFADDEY